METKQVLLNLREVHSLTQEQMADRLHVTRQAISRWENGGTIPSTDLLKLISQEFNISVNTLLGSPVTLICQCCGMPLNDDCISKEPTGEMNEEYCMWCYKDGEFVYKSLEELMAFLVPHMASTHQIEQSKVKSMLDGQLPGLSHWNKTSK